MEEDKHCDVLGLEVKMVYAFFEDKKKIRLMFTFLIGIMMGTVVFNCLNAHEQTKILIYSDYLSDRIQTGNFDRLALLRHVFVYRFKEILILIILGLTQYRYIFHSGIVFYLGIKNSLLMCMLTVMKKEMAAVWFLVLMMPQIIVHAYLIYYIIRMYDGDYVINEKMGKWKRFLFIFLMLGFMSVLETFLNPLLIKCFVKII